MPGEGHIVRFLPEAGFYVYSINLKHIISESNLKLLGTVFSFDDYKKFYDEKFAPLQVPEDLRLDEPTSIEIRTPDDEPPAGDEEYEEEEEDTDSGIIF